MKVCDECTKRLETTAVKIHFSYPSFLDGEEFEFCSDDCAIKKLTKIWVEVRLKRRTGGLK